MLGKLFWAGSLVAMGEREPREVDIALHELARKELVRPARQSSMEGEAEYGFWHLLVRDVAYGQIPRAQRAAKHLSAARWLEGKAGDRVEDMAEVLAYHTGEALTLAQATGDSAFEAEVAPKAARYALLAGERALGLDTSKALALLERARALTSEDDLDFPLVLMRWAEAARHAGRLRDAVDVLERAVSASQARGDVLRAGEGLTTLSAIRWRLGEPGHIPTVEQAIVLLEPHPGPELVAALIELASSQMVTGSYEPAINTLSRALPLAEELGLPVQGRALGVRGGARIGLGDLGGLTDIEQALELLIEEGNGRHAAILQHNLAVCRCHLEGPAAAIAQFDVSQSFCAGRGLAEIARGSAANRVAMLVLNGRLDEALEQAAALAPLLREGGDLLDLIEMRAAEAVALLTRGADATDAIEEVLPIARDSDDPAYLAFVADVAAATLIAAGDRDRATTVIREINNRLVRAHTEYARPLPGLARSAAALGDQELIDGLVDGVPATLPIQLHALVAVRGIQAERAGDYAQAANLYADAAARWEQFTNVLEQAHALFGQGRCLTASGDPVADQQLRHARHLFNQMGARPYVAECDVLIAQASKLSS